MTPICTSTGTYWWSLSWTWRRGMAPTSPRETGRGLPGEHHVRRSKDPWRSRSPAGYATPQTFSRPRGDPRGRLPRCWACGFSRRKTSTRSYGRGDTPGGGLARRAGRAWSPPGCYLARPHHRGSPSPPPSGTRSPGGSRRRERARDDPAAARPATGTWACPGLAGVDCCQAARAAGYCGTTAGCRPPERSRGVLHGSDAVRGTECSKRQFTTPNRPRARESG